ncbi:GntR family transcriptional regulator [Acrocarpospora pleiomorpha]|uniref:GntR family transcriptional regulator n=1 Tax=Acrocarpospora pleiomorpha TaxID=90975 RepID=UPI001FE593F3|nr:GntR family transcriptional regulator [Acrocarpospora pleiomorpha]
MTAQRAASKSDHAYSIIRRRILDGRYAPGFRLVLDRLARELNVSSVPVREAVRRLEAERLVDFERNVGARVSAIDTTEYRHTMQTLAIIEGAATALAAPMVPLDDLATAAEINDRMRRCLDDGDAHTFTTLNGQFHQLLYQRCPNPHIADLVERGWARMGTLRTHFSVPGRAPQSVAEHDRMLGLIRVRADAADIEAFAREHRLATLDAFLTQPGTGHPTATPEEIQP